LIGSLLAAGLAIPEAAAVGAHVHGVAARLAAAGGDGPPGPGLSGPASPGRAPTAAGAMAEHIPAAWRSIAATGPEPDQ
jgi:hypothetical protein